MPELPEVETIKRGLETYVVGRRLVQLKVTLPKWRRLLPPAQRRAVEGRVVERVGRRGKILLIGFSGGVTLLIHLKMTGQLIWREHAKVILAGGHPIPTVKGDLPSKVTHAVFRFDDGSELFFNDLRQFGYLRLVETAALPVVPELASLGRDPLEPGFTEAVMTALLARRPNAKLKPLLLDQTWLSGLGNIYVDEALNLAKLHPLRQAGTLSKQERQSLRRAIVSVLRASLRYGGTSDNTYVTIRGGKGDYLKRARVYHRVGEPCRACGTPIERMVVAARGTHICPVCQRLG